MTDLDEQRWARAGQFIRERMAELQGMTITQLQNISGVNRETLRPIINGEPGNPRAATLHRVAHALGWTAGSIHEILDGDEPTIVRTPTPADDELRASRDVTNTMATVIEGIKPDFIYQFDDGTQVIVEVKSHRGGKIREGEVLQQLHHYLDTLNAPASELIEQLRADTQQAMRHVEERIRELQQGTELDPNDDLLAAAKDDDYYLQELKRAVAREVSGDLPRPGADAPEDQPAP